MEFVQTHVFKDISSMKEEVNYFSAIEEHFQVPWMLCLRRKGDFLAYFLHCELPANREWSIEVVETVKIVCVTGKSFSKNGHLTFGNEARSWGKPFIKWDEMEKDYLVDGNIVIESHVKILKTTGIAKKPWSNFDETAKMFSDVVLIAEEEKFHVSKLFLASQSTYFEAMFLQNFKESGNSEIILKDVSANDLHNFLELLYGESSIDDNTVEGILKLGDMYDAKLAVQKCEQFLMRESEKSLKEKLMMVKLFRLANLKHSCLFKINTVEDIRAVLPYDTNEMDPSVAGALLQKSLSLHK